jgi:hypothetical protein
LEKPIKYLTFMHVPVQSLRYEDAIRALEEVPLSKHYHVMARIICEQHRSIPWSMIEGIIANKLNKKTK